MASSSLTSDARLVHSASMELVRLPLRVTGKPTKALYFFSTDSTAHSAAAKVLSCSLTCSVMRVPRVGAWSGPSPTVQGAMVYEPSPLELHLCPFPSPTHENTSTLSDTMNAE